MSEAEFLKRVIELARLNGWLVAHFHDSRRQVRPGVFVGDRYAAGFPDLVLVRERVVYAELKSDKGRLRPEQTVWLERLQGAGAEAYVWRPANWVTIGQILGGTS
jgi:hypothetical protein